MQIWGSQYEVQITMHHWPTWENAEVTRLIKVQRDTYKFMHDQTLHSTNMDYTMKELPGLVMLPPSLVGHWESHGYYGTKSHNLRAVCNFHLGYFDGNPATLNPLPPVEAGTRYVATLGGADAVLKLGREALEKGDYRGNAELVNHLVYAQPDNQATRNLQADLLEQMRYQAESGPWRGFYLTGVDELRNGVHKMAAENPSSADIIANMSSELLFGYMGVQLDAKKAYGKLLTVNWGGPRYQGEARAVPRDLGAEPLAGFQRSEGRRLADRRPRHPEQVPDSAPPVRRCGPQRAGHLHWNPAKFAELMNSMTNLNQYFWFNIVTP